MINQSYYSVKDPRIMLAAALLGATLIIGGILLTNSATFFSRIRYTKKAHI